MYKILISRFPDKRNLIRVFSTAAFIVYGWTIYLSFRKVPSWMFYLQLDEIFSIYAYSFILDFVESSLLTLGLAFIYFFLSGNLWKGSFSSAGAPVLLIVMGSAFLHLRLHKNSNIRESFVNTQFLWWFITFFIAFITSFVCVRVSWLRSSFENLADRFVVFLYIYIPLTIFSLAIVFVRIVF